MRAAGTGTRPGAGTSTNQHKLHAELAHLRREDILALLADGLSFRKIGAAIGID
jgi:hypothetical protein